MTSPLERARLLDAEMRLQRAWLELSLKSIATSARASPWSKLNSLKLGAVGLSLLKHRTVWLAAVSMLMGLYRRYAHKEKT